MDCDEFVELVTRFLDGALDADTERRFHDHLAVCEGCEIYLAQIRRTVREVGALAPEQLSGQARATLLTAFRDWHERG
ncbi:anti-sigma factor [Nocardia neocaledoniensis NBRC 108232]|uniref:Putative zinc finger protein n=1 Tax=Nocardia neocaledoniensis TaxID=236511 RepID=A0A317NY00_9NOCA|nr:zf-HC2 domain-containing protein [Nocardia neocaledoniensis]PWV79064.1 putative zinc finger protein [Nocardia neocaledoniensis]GEM32410.1 anti-sigma factor [Nocardia neocaledoniensis NBRC 108232]